MKNKKSFYFIVFLLLGIVLFGFSIWQSGFENIVKTLKQFSLIKFLILVAISILNFWFFSLRWEVIVNALFKEKKIPSSTFFMDRLAGYAISYVTPSAQLGGEPLRIMMLEEEGVPKRIAASSSIIDKALEIATLIVFIAIGVFLALFEPNLSSEAKTGMFIATIFLLSIVFWFFYTSLNQIGFFTSIIKLLHLRKIKKLENLEHKMMEFESEMNLFYKNHKKTVLKLIALNLLTIGFMLFEHYLVAYFLGIKMTFFQTFLASTIPYIAYLLPIPGGLGILESGHAAIFTMLGVNINAFVFVFILRLRDFIFVILGIIRGSQKGIKLLRKELKEEYSPKV